MAKLRIYNDIDSQDNKFWYQWLGGDCVAKGFDFNVRDIVINAGAEMIVAIAGNIMRMPGLPKVPAAMHIDIVNGQIEGLS